VTDLPPPPPAGDPTPEPEVIDPASQIDEAAIKAMAQQFFVDGLTFMGRVGGHARNNQSVELIIARDAPQLVEAAARFLGTLPTPKWVAAPPPWVIAGGMLGFAIMSTGHAIHSAPVVPYPAETRAPGAAAPAPGAGAQQQQAHAFHGAEAAFDADAAFVGGGH